MLGNIEGLYSSMDIQYVIVYQSWSVCEFIRLSLRKNSDFRLTLMIPTLAEVRYDVGRVPYRRDLSGSYYC